MSDLGELLEAVHSAPGKTALKGIARLERKARPDIQRDRYGVTKDVNEASQVAVPDFEIIEFWYSSGSWRLDVGGTVTSSCEDRLHFYTPERGMVTVPSSDTRAALLGTVGKFLCPMTMLSSYQIELLGVSSILNRTAWHMSLNAPRNTASGEPVQVEAWIDRDSGILMKCQNPKLSITELEVLSIDIDVAMDPSVFAIELPKLSNATKREPRVTNGLRLRAAQHIPTGPPPADERFARAAIEHAFVQMADRSIDHPGLVNVQTGENLGPCADEIARRFPQYAGSVAPTILEVKFLSDSEAVVWFALSGQDVNEGRAVLDRDRWQVSRVTYCDLLSRAGIICPPPS